MRGYRFAPLAAASNMIVLGALGLYALGARAQGNSYSWATPVDGEFSDSANWSQPFGQNGSYPMAGDSAEFDGGAYTVTCSGDANAYTEVDSDITFLLDGSYDVESSLTISTNVTVSGEGLLTAGSLAISP